MDLDAVAQSFGLTSEDAAYMGMRRAHYWADAGNGKRCDRSWILSEKPADKVEVKEKEHGG